MKKKEFSMNSFLKQVKKKVTCAYCKDPELYQAVKDYLAAKAAGSTCLSVNYMYENCFVPLLGAPKRYGALTGHIRKCLGIDPQTGESLNGT